MIWALLFPMGLATGIVAGMMGLGGGVVMIPLLMEAFAIIHPELPNSAMAMGTAQLVSCVASMMAVRSHLRYTVIDWGLIGRIFLGAMVGGVIGAWIATGLEVALMRRIFACFMVFVAARYLLARKKKEDLPPPAPINRNLHSLAGTGIGAFAAFFGVGGGILAVPYLRRFAGKSAHDAIAQSSGLIVFTTFYNACAYAFIGMRAGVDAPYTVGYVNLAVALIAGGGAIFGARIGVGIARKLSSKGLTRTFALLLIVIALRMFLKG